MRYRISTYMNLAEDPAQPAAVFYFVLEGREGVAYAFEVGAERSLFERCNLRDPSAVTNTLYLLARYEFMYRLHTGSLQRHQRCVWADDEPTARMVAALEPEKAAFQINTWLPLEEPAEG